MGKVSNKMVILQLAVSKALAKDEYGDVRSMLDEYLHTPLWSEQVHMTIYLNKHCNGALFTYDHLDGWSYTEEGD